MLKEELLFDDNHIEVADSIDKKIASVSFYISNNPVQALTQELILNEQLEEADLLVLDKLSDVPKILFIEKIFVKEKYRREGKGTQLINDIKNICIEEDIKHIILISKDKDLSYQNLKFYFKNGFKLIDGINKFENLLIKVI